MTERCGYRIEHSDNYGLDRPGAYRVSKDGLSNIVGEDLWLELGIDQASDQDFETMMHAMLAPNFPHPVMLP